MASAAVLIHPPRQPSPSSTTTTTTTANDPAQRHQNILYSSYHSSAIPLGLSTSSGPTVWEKESHMNYSSVLGAPQEVHLLKVTAGDTLQIEPAPGSGDKSRFSRPAPAPIVIQPERDYSVGPPPPSPPTSVDHREDDDNDQLYLQQQPRDTSPSPSRMLHTVQSDPTAARNASVSMLDPNYDKKNTLGAPHRPNPIRISSPQQLPQALQRSSTDTKASYATSTSSITTPRTIITQPSPPLSSAEHFYSANSYSYSTPHAESSTSSPSSLAKAAHLSIDGYLQPPTPLSAKPTRRNTTGSTPHSKRDRDRDRDRGLPSPSPHTKVSSQPFASSSSTTDDAMLGEGGLELASDIELHAERIRRERMSKRAKQQQQLQQAEAEAALLTRKESLGGAAVNVGAPAGVAEEAPLVGNLIGEDHVNYVLMYNMLTGIRIGVSRCQAKVKRPLTDEDFTARHKFSFDIVGNELTPSAKYDFKFKDYAPWVFRYLREDIFHLDPADYLLSLTAKYILSELGSPGKSGSFFYFSRDYKYIIKTIRHSEHKFLLSILPKYYDYVKENPHTLLSRFYGLHRVKLPRGRKIHFVIMNNLFPAHKDIHETYDLKGSTVGREYPEEKAARNPRAVLKDLNWIKRGNRLELGPEKRALLTEQVRRDEEFLRSVSVMDYSLLVGIHHLKRGNKENVRRNTLKVFSPNLPGPRQSKSSLSTHSHTPSAIALRRAIRLSDPKRLGSSSHSHSGSVSGIGIDKDALHLPESDTGDRDRQEFVFYQDEGGLRATDDQNEEMGVIYYLGVIDILTPWGVKKRMEGFWKGLGDDRHKISPVPPDEYAERFFGFIKAIMRGGDGPERFLPQPHAGPCGPLFSSCCCDSGTAHTTSNDDEVLPTPATAAVKAEFVGPQVGVGNGNEKVPPRVMTSLMRDPEKEEERMFVSDLARREAEWVKEDEIVHERGLIARRRKGWSAGEDLDLDCDCGEGEGGEDATARAGPSARQSEKMAEAEGGVGDEEKAGFKER